MLRGEINQSVRSVMIENLSKFLLGKKRMLKFAIVGLSGTAIYMGLLYTLTEWVGLWYMASAVIGTGVVFLYSYNLNNRWTFKDRK